MKNGLSAGNKECQAKKKENRQNLSIFIRFNFSVRKNCKKHKDNLTGHVLHLNNFCRILSGILIKNMNLSGFCLVVKTIIPLSSPFFLVPAIHRQNKTEKKWNTTGLESCLQNFKACIIGSSNIVFFR